MLPVFSLYRLGPQGQILDHAQHVDSPDDQTAGIAAAALSGDHDAVEIWEGKRFVGRVKPGIAAIDPAPLVRTDNHV